MRALLLMCWLAAPAPAADLPEKKDDPPHAVLKFPDDPRKGPKSWEMTLEMTTASGATYELPVNLDGSKGNVYCGWTQVAAVTANWMSDRDWSSYTLHIYGVRTKESKGDPVKSLVLTNRLVDGKGELPRLEAVGGVKVETREADPEAKPDPARKAPPAGPDLGKQAYVEFDFSTLPPGGKCDLWNMTLKLHMGGRDEVYGEEFGFAPEYARDGGLCRLLADRFREASLKAERVGKTTLRVYGLTRKDRYYPVLKGEVESPDLKAKDLPKVTNPPRL
ncbi:MAG: hypothetical protein C0501_18020 [Isosphaera sp.]|nr:hypothetical protein [Isosphaera sp.]